MTITLFTNTGRRAGSNPPSGSSPTSVPETLYCLRARATGEPPFHLCAMTTVRDYLIAPCSVWQRMTRISPCQIKHKGLNYLLNQFFTSKTLITQQILYRWSILLYYSQKEKAVSPFIPQYLISVSISVQSDAVWTLNVISCSVYHITLSTGVIIEVHSPIVISLFSN